MRLLGSDLVFEDRFFRFFGSQLFQEQIEDFLILVLDGPVNRVSAVLIFFEDRFVGSSGESSNALKCLENASNHTCAHTAHDSL